MPVSFPKVAGVGAWCHRFCLGLEVRVLSETLAAGAGAVGISKNQAIWLFLKAMAGMDMSLVGYILRSLDSMLA